MHYIRSLAQAGEGAAVEAVDDKTSYETDLGLSGFEVEYRVYPPVPGALHVNFD